LAEKVPKIPAFLQLARFDWEASWLKRREEKRREEKRRGEERREEKGGCEENLVV
jgi:hypothetical protein